MADAPRTESDEPKRRGFRFLRKRASRLHDFFDFSGRINAAYERKVRRAIEMLHGYFKDILPHILIGLVVSIVLVVVILVAIIHVCHIIITNWDPANEPVLLYVIFSFIEIIVSFCRQLMTFTYNTVWAVLGHLFTIIVNKFTIFICVVCCAVYRCRRPFW